MKKETKNVKLVHTPGICTSFFVFLLTVDSASDKI